MGGLSVLVVLAGMAVVYAIMFGIFRPLRLLRILGRMIVGLIVLGMLSGVLLSTLVAT